MAKAPQVDARAAKREALQAAISQIEKEFGKGAIQKLGDTNGLDVEVVPTGSLNLDIALGVGGIPRGRVIEIYGPEAAGKSTLAMHIVKEVQRSGGIAGYIDAEHAVDPAYASGIGVNVNELYISQPDSGEQGLEICETMVRSGAVDVIVIDSVAALVPQKEIDGDMGDAVVGSQARLMSQALRKLTAAVNKTKCIIIFINQLREKIGITFGNPETTTGGRALKFYASVRMEIRKVEAIKVNGDVIGNHVRVKIVNNKVAPPFREAEFDIIFGKGISKEGDVLDAALRDGTIRKSGAWFYYKEDQIGQGREAAKKFLAENPDIMQEIEDRIRGEYIIQPKHVLETNEKVPEDFEE